MHLFPLLSCLLLLLPSVLCSLLPLQPYIHSLLLLLFTFFFILHTIMNTNTVEKFSEFYNKWVFKLEKFLHLLLEVSKKGGNENSEQEMLVLVSQVTTHIKEYYTVKWGAAHEDVLVFFSPIWLSPLENAYLWFTGWKPSTVFKLIESLNKTTTFSITGEQVKKIEALRMRIRIEEDKVESEMERHQVALADRKMVELARMSSRATNGGGSGGDAVVVAKKVDAAMKEVLARLERILKSSDCVRLKTLKGVLDLLTPMQCVYFLAANIAMQLRLKQGEKKRVMAGTIMNDK